MAITIISEPTAQPVPTPVSDCLQWCFQPDDADIFSTPGSNASINIEFPATFGSIPANGTEFTIWGRVFTVDSTTPSTANSFKIVSSGNNSATNFRAMLNSNFFFGRSTSIQIGASLRFTDIIWNTCGEQDNFTGSNMDFASLVSAGAVVVVTNGVTPVLVPGAMVQVRLLKADNLSGVFSPITKYEGITPSGQCDTADELCVDFMQDARRTMFTPMPDLSLTSEIDPDETTMMGQFKIGYGVTFRDETCVPQTGVFAESDVFLVMDTVFELQENLGMRRYIYDHPVNLGFAGQPALSPQFLTNKPKYLALGINSYAWLWLAAGYQSLAPTNINLRFTVTYTNGTTANADVLYPALLIYQVHCFNVSPGRLLSLFSLSNLSTVSKYLVRATTDTGGGTTVGWETYFSVEQACEDMVDVYFKMSPGGIGTILCEVTDNEVVQDGTEICLNTPCSTNRIEKAKYGGRMMNSLRSYEKVTLRIRRNFNDDEVAYFRALKASPERWIQVQQTGEFQATGNYIAKRLLVETGGIKIFQSGEYIDLIITGTIGDIPIQSPRGI